MNTRRAKISYVKLRESCPAVGWQDYILGEIVVGSRDLTNKGEWPLLYLEEARP